MTEDNISGLNGVYREIAEIFGNEFVAKFYENFRGQQVVYPVSLYLKEHIMKCILEEYDGTNSKELSMKYGYTENWLLHKIKSSKVKRNENEA